MKTKVYLDTSVISALFDERTPERLAMTSNFWSKLDDYEVFISELVLEELERVNEQVRDKMFSEIEDFIVLKISKEAEKLAQIYVKQGIFQKNTLMMHFTLH
jgi:predicted nucleic acid-binding protein